MKDRAKTCCFSWKR